MVEGAVPTDRLVELSRRIIGQLSKGKKHSVKVSANFDGKVAGRMDGAVLATMEVASPDGKDGKYTVFTRTLFDNGEIQDAQGSGRTTHTGDHKWLVAGIAETSNGRSYAITGEIDFPARRFTGKIYNRGAGE